MAVIENRRAIYTAADQWKRDCLLRDGSVFGRGEIWTAEHATELIHHFVDNPDESKRKFEEKLLDQLELVTAGAKQLASEMLWVIMLFPSNVTGDRKVELLRTVWVCPARHSRIRITHLMP